MELFEDGQDTKRKACTEMVEAALQSMGFDAAGSRMKSEAGPAWGLVSGSARVYIFITRAAEGDDYIQVSSPVMRPPPESNALFLRLLEFNGTELTGASFGIRGSDVVLTTDRSTSGLDQVEVEEMIRRISGYADFYDDILTVEFGGTRFSDL